MVRLVRHRQTKGAATDRPDLQSRDACSLLYPLFPSVILTTEKDFTNWGEFFRDENVAVPIVDRLIHHSHVFMLGGESYRLKQKIGN
jgi:hypothetical protein